MVLDEVYDELLKIRGDRTWRELFLSALDIQHSPRRMGRPTNKVEHNPHNLGCPMCGMIREATDQQVCPRCGGDWQNKPQITPFSPLFPIHKLLI